MNLAQSQARSGIGETRYNSNRHSHAHFRRLVSMVRRNALVGLFAVTLLFLLSDNYVFAADISGALEYQENCARCHGADTTGNGIEMHKPGYYPKDLTHISRNHGGKFPRQEIYDIIDGGKRLSSHYNFNSPMPLWGLSFQLKRQRMQQSERGCRQTQDRRPARLSRDNPRKIVTGECAGLHRSPGRYQKTRA